MWLLECDDYEMLKGTRMWLRPGSRCVLGRVKQDDVTVSVSSRSISRRHLVIDVGKVGEGDGLKLHSRSTITLQDCGTKHGTRLNGEAIKGSEVTLDGRDEHVFYMGQHPHAFRLKWVPVVFSFSRTVKSTMPSYRAKVENLDIKTISAWTDKTSHVVATKRNTAIGIQALIAGRHIVTSSYLDAVAEAATLPPVVEEGETPRSALEIDFDAAWPKPEDFLPPAGNEPTSRPAEAYKPDHRRRNLFEGWTFVFSDDVQYQNLLGVITDAGGKSEKFELKYRETRPEELVRFVEKRGGADTCVVRFRTKNEDLLEWERDFAERVQEQLGFRMVEQNEFLEVILSCDTALLRRPVFADSFTTAATAPAESQREIPRDTPSAQILTETNTAPTTRPRVKLRKRIAPSIDPFSFDDLPPLPDPEMSAVWSNDNPTGAASMNALLPAPMEVDEPVSSLPASSSLISQPPPPPSSSFIQPLAAKMGDLEIIPAASSIVTPQKRSPRAAVAAAPDLDVMDLLPGARSVKRRKLAEEAARGPSPSPSPAPEPIKEEEEEPAAAAATEKPGKKKSKPLTPYEAQLRDLKSREAAEAEEEEKKGVDEMLSHNIDGVRGLGVVEFFKVKPRKPPVEREGRWKPEWEGRKNFKAFRRAGRPVGEKVTRKVKVVEWNREENGYWEDNDDDIRERGSRGTTRDEEETEARVRSWRERREGRTATPQTQTQTQTLASSSTVTSQGIKRPAVSQSGRTEGKKAKLSFEDEEEESESSSSDDDGMKFRLPRIRR